MYCICKIRCFLYFLRYRCIYIKSYFKFKIKNISKVKFDYYNKCKMSFDIICMDEKVTLKLICMENMIDRIYSKLKIGKMIFVYGVLLENNSVITRNIEIIR